MDYDPSRPYESGLLQVGDGHVLHWEQYGIPHGMPALALHGGPGGGAGNWMTHQFDLSSYRLVLHDQRGAGRSTPYASEPSVDLTTNTTWHLVADIERLRDHLGIERWLVYTRPVDVTADAAARAWCEWENALVAHETGGRADPRYDDPRFRLGFARLVTHYFSHAARLEDDQLLSGAARLAGVPGVLRVERRGRSRHRASVRPSA